MTPTQYLRAFARFWWLVAICTAAGGGLALLLDGVSAPPFTSTSHVLVSVSKSASTSTADAYYGTLLAQQRALSYAELAQGSEVASSVIDDLGLSTTAADLESRIRVEVPANTAVLTISVDDTSSARAERIATEAADVVAGLIDAQEATRGKGTPLLRARAVGEASTPTASTARRNAWLGAAGGLVAGLLLAVAAARLDPRLRDQDAVAQAAGREVIGVLPVRPRRLPLPRKDSSAARSDAIRELRTSLFFRHPGADHSLTVALTSIDPLDELPGLATELAAALADTDARVLLIEADLRAPRQASLLRLAGEHGAGLATFLDGSRQEHDAIRHHTDQGFDVVPAGSTSADPADLLHSHAFTDVVADAARHYDFVLLTAPALSIGTDALAVAARSDLTLVGVVRGRTHRAHLAVASAQLSGVEAQDVRALLVT